MSTTAYQLARTGDMQASRGMATAAGFFLSFRLFIMLLSVRVLGTEPQTGVEIGLALNFLFLIVTAFYALGNVRYPLRAILKMPSVKWAILFLAFSGTSLLWSVSASMGAAIVYWCALLADVAMVALLLRADTPEGAAYSLMRGYVWGACLIAAIAWIMPAQSDLRLGDEELLGGNQIGYLCGFAIYFAQYLARHKTGRWWPAILLLCVTLLRSLSKTTIIAFVVSQAFVMLWDTSMSRKAKIWLMVAALLVIACFGSLLASYYDVYANAGSQPETLTGRLGIWAYILAEAVDKPWIGHGFHSVWKVIPPFGPDQFEARHAHNELIQQFYAYGVVGIGLFAGIYGSFYRQAKRLSSKPEKIFYFSLLIFVLIRGLADTEAFDLSLPLWGIVMFSALMAYNSDARSAPPENVIPL